VVKKIIFVTSVVDSLLSYAQNSYPNEGILLLRGMVHKDEIIVKNVIIPPFALHGRGFSSFPLHMLPLDLSILGTAHSHPSGNLQPSVSDLNHFYGKIMVIVAYPYRSKDDMGVFDREGNKVKYSIGKK